MDAAMRDTGGMPRQTPRLPGPDDWAAQRVRYERERRGWSTAELARRVTEAGCPLRQQSVWDIENRQPPRRMSIGEAVALADVFGLRLEDITKAPHETVTDEIAGLVSEAQPILARLLDALSRYRQLEVGAWRGVFVYGHPLPVYLRELLDQFSEIEDIVRPHLDAPEQGAEL